LTKQDTSDDEHKALNHIRNKIIEVSIEICE